MSFFFFNDTATTEIYTLSLHDALPIFKQAVRWAMLALNPADSVELPKIERKEMQALTPEQAAKFNRVDRKSTRLNSSHRCISYAVFCLKKKKKKKKSR